MYHMFKTTKPNIDPKKLIENEVNNFKHNNIVPFFTNNIFKIGFVLHSIENHFSANYYCYLLLEKTYPKTRPLIVVLTRSHCGKDFCMSFDEKDDWNIYDILDKFYNYFSSLQCSHLEYFSQKANQYNETNKVDIAKELYDIV